MKLTKSDCTLNERDALQDMLDSEKQLMEIYTTALSRAVQNAYAKAFPQIFLGLRKTSIRCTPK